MSMYAVKNNPLNKKLLILAGIGFIITFFAISFMFNSIAFIQLKKIISLVLFNQSEHYSNYFSDKSISDFDADDYLFLSKTIHKGQSKLLGNVSIQESLFSVKNNEVSLLAKGAEDIAPEAQAFIYDHVTHADYNSSPPTLFNFESKNAAGMKTLASIDFFRTKDGYMAVMFEVPVSAGLGLLAFPLGFIYVITILLLICICILFYSFFVHKQKIDELKHTCKDQAELEILASIVDSSADSNLVLDSENNCIYSNPAVLALTGYEAHEILGQGYKQLIMDKTLNELSENFQVNESEKDSKTETFEIIKKDGCRRTVELRYFELKSIITTKILGTAFIIRDVTERKRLELLELHSLAILDSYSDYIGVFDLDNKIVFLNNSCTKLTGYTKEEHMKISFSKLYGKKYANKLVKYGLPYAQVNGAWSAETEIVHKDGHRIPVSQTLFRVADQEGNTTYVGTVITDIRERKNAIKLIQENTAFLQAVLDNFPGAIWSVDIDLRILFFNTAGLKQMRATPFNIVKDKTLFEVFPTNKVLVENVLNSIATRTNSMWLDKFGDVYFDNYSSLIYDENGLVKSVVVVSVDVDKRILVQEQLVEAKEIAELASQAKGEFLSKMSHEIRTPLNAIIGMAKIAENSTDIKKIRESLEKLNVASMHLLQVINDILDISKIESGKLVLSIYDFDLEKNLKALIEVVEHQTHENKLFFVINIDPELPTLLRGDSTRFTQVLMNLISNAIKFTPENGRIVLTLKKGRFENNKIELLIKVKDTGIGVAKENIDRIFSSFEQVDGSYARKYTGTGLGLPITKSIIELMGGDIRIRSEIGKGTEFSFNVWLELAEQPLSIHSQNPQIVDTELKHVLIIEDNSEESNYVYELLIHKHIRCQQAFSGEEANIASKRAVKDGDPFNIYLIDYYMPGKNGLETIEELKKHAVYNAVFILITGIEWSVIEQQALKIGVSKYILKPVLPTELMNLINQTFVSEPSQLENPVKEIIDLTGFNILVFEDVEINREITEFFLAPTGVSMDFAFDGIMGLDMYKRNPEKYDLILMDVQMPRMDGYEATETIRKLSTANAKYIPIIAMTANVFKEDIERTSKSGMNDHIGKPMDENQVLGVLKKYLSEDKNVKKKNRIAKQIPEGDIPDAVEKLENKEIETKEILIEGADMAIDVEEKIKENLSITEGLKILNGNKKLYTKLLKNFFEDDDLVLNLQKSLNEGDIQNTRLNAHSIKGVASNLGITKIHLLATALEGSIKATNTITEEDTNLANEIIINFNLLKEHLGSIVDTI